MADEITAEDIATAATDVASATAPDGRSATAHPLRDLIAADEYLARKNAQNLASKFPRRIGFTKIIPPGAE